LAVAVVGPLLFVNTTLLTFVGTAEVRFSGVEVEFNTGTDEVFSGVEVTLENGADTGMLVFAAVLLAKGLDVEFTNGVETGALVLKAVVFISGLDVELMNGVETGMLVFAAVVFNIGLEVTLENVGVAKLEFPAPVALMFGVLLALTALSARQCNSLVVVVRTVWLGPALLNKCTPPLFSRGRSVVTVCTIVLQDIL
jgi:hypothetical protein